MKFEDKGVKGVSDTGGNGVTKTVCRFILTKYEKRMMAECLFREPRFDVRLATTRWRQYDGKKAPAL